MSEESSVFFAFMLIFFFKQKTAYVMRISDWSSDVCSSDHSNSSPIERGQELGGRRGRAVCRLSGCFVAAPLAAADMAVGRRLREPVWPRGVGTRAIRVVREYPAKRSAGPPLTPA